MVEQGIENPRVSGSIPLLGTRFAGLAQLVEQLICNQWVISSNPLAGTILFARIAQLVEQGIENPRVSGSIPLLGTRFAGLAQLVEQLICNQWVISSNPLAGTTPLLTSLICHSLHIKNL